MENEVKFFPSGKTPSLGAKLRVVGMALCLGFTLQACVNGEKSGYLPNTNENTHEYRVVELVDGLEHPWALAFLPNGDILVTERPGRVRLVRGGELLADPLQGAPEVWVGNQGGMLDIALAPDFSRSNLVYFTYSKAIAGGPATTAVARARFENDRFHNVEDVFVANAPGDGRHFGSRLVFDHDGMLFVSVGERGQLEPAQDLSNHVGTTIRIHPDGRAPADNPFVGQPGALPEIYSYGHRNVQGMAVHPETGDVWQNEHGPRGGDEINLIRAGSNYGWPLANWANHYSGEVIPTYDEVEGVVAPLAYWIPAIAPSGMAFYTGDRFPHWKGHSFNGSLVGRHLLRVVFDGTEMVHQERLLEDYGQRIRDVRDGPDGYLYILTDEANGVLARIEPL